MNKVSKMKFLGFFTFLLTLSEAAFAAGLPQLDFGIYPTQIFWTFVLFFVMYIVVGRFALPRVSNVVEDRKDKIEDDVTQAALMEKEANNLKLEYENAIDQVRSQAFALIKEESHKLDNEIIKWTKDLETKINERLKQADKRITKMKNDVLDDLQNLSQDITKDVVSKLTGKTVANDVVDDVVKEVIDGIQ